jgi:hypothetical protein
MRAASLGWKLYGRDTAKEWEAVPVIVKYSDLQKCRIKPSAQKWTDGRYYSLN